MPDVKELGRKVKAKYPGVYDDLSDDDLGRKVKAKYPGAYDDFTDTPAAQPPGFIENALIGPARGAIKYIADPLLAIAEGWVSPQSSAQSGELAARGAKQLASQYVDPTGQLAAEQAPAIQAGQRKLAASRANTPGFKQTKAALDYLNARAALDPSVTGKITRGTGEVAVGALPAIATGAYGGAPMAAGVAALQSAAQPEGAAFNVGASVALPAVAGEIVGPAFKSGINAVRRAFGKGAAQIIEAEALPAATAQVRQSIPEAAPTAGNANPTVQRAMQQFDEAVQRINASNLTPAQKAAELDAAIKTIGREASGARPAPTSVYPPEMVMPENPNPIQRAGVLPRTEAEMALPKLEADLGAPSVKAAPDLPYTETVGPRINEPTDALNAAVSNAAKSVPAAQRAKDELLGLLGASKSLRSTLDISYPLRQGAILLLRPLQWRQAGRVWKQMFRGFKTKNFEAIKDAIETHPLAERMDGAGLYRGMVGGEEAFAKRAGSKISEVVNKTPGVKHSEQAYTAAADTQRVGAFEQYARLIDKAGLSAEEALKADKAAAQWINITTGRGSLGQRIDRAMEGLNFFFFSPRFVASRLNVLNPVMYARNAASPGGRVVLKQQMADLAQFASVVGTTLYLAKQAGADVTLNPKSADFGKIKVGSWRWDLGAGLSQVMRLYYRVGEDFARAGRGEKPKFGKSAIDVGETFLSYKLSPPAGVFRDFIKQRTVEGKDPTVGHYIENLIVPMQWADFVEAYQKEAWGGVLKTLPGAVGVGVQNYDLGPVDAAIEKTRPLFTELKRLDKRISDLRKKDGEKDDAFNARVQQFSQNYTQYGQKLLDSPRFKAAPDNIKALALDALNNRAKAVTSRELALPELVLDPDTIMDAAENSKKNPERNK